VFEDRVRRYWAERYAALLTSRDVLDEHPRQGDLFVKVLRLKPHWTTLAQSFHWATDEDDKEVEAGPHESFMEGLYIGKLPGDEEDSDEDEDDESEHDMDVDA